MQQENKSVGNRNRNLQIPKAPLDSQAIVGRGSALVETVTFNRRVVGSTPALATT